MKPEELSQPLRSAMKSDGIDIARSLEILQKLNDGAYDSVKPIDAAGVPTVDGRTIIDRTTPAELTLSLDDATQRLEDLLPGTPIWDVATVAGSECRFSETQLYWIGMRLLPATSYGVLNGGSATSYADEKKNRGFSEPLFNLVRDDFDRLAELSRGRAKGLTPAYINPDGSPGASFLELKMRNLLVWALRYQKAYGRPASGPLPLFPAFQMTSVYNNEEVAAAYDEYRRSPLLAPLIAECGIDITRVETGVQEMLSAFTHSSEGTPRRIFDRAYGKENTPLPLPGGHGQNFTVLSSVYRSLAALGKRFVYLGNVDNLGFTPDPVSIALLALSGKQAAFDFSFRTPVDVKGGILVRERSGGLACADIGPAISPEAVFEAEERGTPILFNCASGLFRLDYLVANLDRITEDLPMRISDQDKDAGRYAQAEQVTWEIIAMLDDFLVFGVDKYRRFLAAKMLLEGIMTSGRRLDSSSYPTNEDPAKDLRATAQKLHGGLTRALREEFAMDERDGRRQPRDPRDIAP